MKISKIKSRYIFQEFFSFISKKKRENNSNDTKYKNLAGIYEYKRKIGGTYVEFIGEFDLINKPIWYLILPKLLKIYRKIKK